MPENDAPKIQIDSDWKAQAQAEKEKLAQQEKQAAQQTGGGRRGPGQMPPATIEVLISTLATPALLAMGLIADPSTGQRYQSLELARHHIDMLALLDEKTSGNLSEEESKLLKQTLFELRQNYIRIASAARG